MNTHAASVAALRAECVAVAYKIAKLSAALEKTKAMLNAVVPASPLSPVMADIATMGDKAGTVSVRNGEMKGEAAKVGGKVEMGQAIKVGGKIEVDQTVKIGGKAEVDKVIKGNKMAGSAFDNDDTMAAVTRLFSKPPKSARKVDALARDDVLGAVARMFRSHKAAVDAFANDVTMGAVAEMFSDRDASPAKMAIQVEQLLCVPLFLSWVVLFGHCVPKKPRIDALANDGVMAAVAALFKQPKSSKRDYDAYSDDLVLLTVERMFGGAKIKTPAVDALADNGIMQAQSAMFKEPKPEKLVYDAYADDLVLLTAKRMFGGADGPKPAICALAEEGIMDAVAALFENQPAAQTDNGVRGAPCLLHKADDAAAYVAQDKSAMAVCKSCISAQWPDLRLFSCVESRESLELPGGNVVHETESLHAESDEPETSDIAVRDNEPEKEHGRPIDATFGMGSLVQKAYAKAPPNMMLGMAVRAGLRAPWRVPALQRVPDMVQSSVDSTEAAPSD